MKKYRVVTGSNDDYFVEVKNRFMTPWHQANLNGFHSINVAVEFIQYLKSRDEKIALTGKVVHKE
jgi:hypothetical protein